MKSVLTIDLVSDLVSPWCYLGRRRLDRALARLEGASVPVLRWAPLELHPAIPKQGLDLDEYLASVFGSPEAARPAMTLLKDLGERDGIRFEFERVRSVPNTLDAHRLILHAEAEDRQPQLVETLYRAFFEEGQDIGRAGVLVELAGRAGLDSDVAREYLASERGIDDVRDREARMKAVGLTGVPSFVINDRVAVLGAQEPDTILEAIDQALFHELPDSPPRESLH